MHNDWSRACPSATLSHSLITPSMARSLSTHSDIRLPRGIFVGRSIADTLVVIASLFAYEPDFPYLIAAASRQSSPLVSMATSSPHDTAPQGIDIEAWTDSAVAAVPLSTASISASIVAAPTTIRRTTSMSLDIPLDAEAEKSQTQQRREARELKARILARDAGDSDDDGPAPTGYVRCQSGGKPRRRDSMKRREALLKGKEGSRRRQKWENGTSNARIIASGFAQLGSARPSSTDTMVQTVFLVTPHSSLLSHMTGLRILRTACRMCLMS